MTIKYDNTKSKARKHPPKKSKILCTPERPGWSVKLFVDTLEMGTHWGTRGRGSETNGDGAKMFNDRQDVPAIEHLRTQTPSKMGPLLYPVPVVPKLYTNTSKPEFSAYSGNKGKKNRPFGLRAGEELSRGAHRAVSASEKRLLTP